MYIYVHSKLSSASWALLTAEIVTIAIYWLDFSKKVSASDDHDVVAPPPPPNQCEALVQ